MLRLISPSLGHSILRIAATSGILAGAFTLFRLGYLILTVDAVIKLFLTFIYTHLNFEDKSERTKAREFLANRKNLSVVEPQEPGELEDLKVPLVSVNDLTLHNEEPEVVGCVVGWREDEELYARCLQSLISSPSCTAIVAGIDGDEGEDERMVEIFQTVSCKQACHSLPSRGRTILGPCTSCSCVPDDFLDS